MAALPVRQLVERVGLRVELRERFVGGPRIVVEDVGLGALEEALDPESVAAGGVAKSAIISASPAKSPASRRIRLRVSAAASAKTSRGGAPISEDN